MNKEDYFIMPSLTLTTEKPYIWLTNTEFVALIHKIFIVKDYNQFKDDYLDNLKALKIDDIDEIVKDYMNIAKGLSGEKEVNDYLSQFSGKWEILQGVNIPTKDSLKSTEIDSIVIANGHIFPIEVKNYSNQTLNITKDGMVDIEYSDGSSTSDQRKNFIRQSTYHSEALAVFLNDKLSDTNIDFFPLVHPIIVIANTQDNLVINNESLVPVIRTHLLSQTILQYKANLETANLAKEISQTICKYSVPDKLFSHLDPTYYFYNFIIEYRNLIIDEENS